MRRQIHSTTADPHSPGQVIEDLQSWNESVFGTSSTVHRVGPGFTGTMMDMWIFSDFVVKSYGIW